MGKFTELFGLKPRVVVLEAFAENPEIPLSVPDISRMSGVEKGSLYTHVRYLVDEGILKKTKKGRPQYYEFNNADPRGEALAFLESTLAIGALGQRIKEDIGLLSTQDLPSLYYTPRPRIVESHHPLSVSSPADMRRRSSYQTITIGENSSNITVTIPSLEKEQEISSPQDIGWRKIDGQGIEA